MGVAAAFGTWQPLLEGFWWAREKRAAGAHRELGAASAAAINRATRPPGKPAAHRAAHRHGARGADRRSAAGARSGPGGAGAVVCLAGAPTVTR